MKYEYHSRYFAMICRDCGWKHVYTDTTVLGPAPGSRDVHVITVTCPHCRGLARLLKRKRRDDG